MKTTLVTCFPNRFFACVVETIDGTYKDDLSCLILVQDRVNLKESHVIRRSDT